MGRGFCRKHDDLCTNVGARVGVFDVTRLGPAEDNVIRMEGALPRLQNAELQKFPWQSALPEFIRPGHRPITCVCDFHKNNSLSSRVAITDRDRGALGDRCACGQNARGCQQRGDESHAVPNGEAERPRRSLAGASLGLRSSGALSALPHDLSRTAPAIVRSHPTDHHCARAALRRQAKAPYSNVKRAQASNKEGVGVNHASASKERTRRAPRPRAQPQNAARAHLVGAERRRLKDNRVSAAPHAAEPIEGHPQLFAAQNFPEVTSNGEVERRAVFAAPSEGTLSITSTRSGPHRS